MKKISLTIPSVEEDEAELTLFYVDKVDLPQDVLNQDVLNLSIKDKNLDETIIEIPFEELENALASIRVFYPWTI